ncbi:hypothetical protein GPJ56_010198 [Histomonas meleagridis]|uniref:uncharacterized protein n=1 Tax=Histomonas meleagridis TaxID=135588 RepID=UPI00355A1BB7|nr:hypothetical protein GPJ56_010198 [Histomonas meleagridis]KAH0797067.1 hypothetical protein GO595_010960 [Histomonas meleagridis]
MNGRVKQNVSSLQPEHFDPSSLMIDSNAILINCKRLTVSSDFKPEMLKKYKEELLNVQSMLINYSRQYEEGIQQTRNLICNFSRQLKSKNSTINISKPLNIKKSGESKTPSANQTRTIDKPPSQNEKQPVSQLDVWLQLEPLFKKLPSRQELTTICHPNYNFDVLPKRQHWRDCLEPYVERTRRETKKKIYSPPPPPPPPTEKLDYWKTNAPPFQMEEAQKQISSTMHYLLSAFVEAKPIKTEKNANNDRQGPPIHMLPPELPFDDYLSHSFDERLEFELQAVGLQKPDNDEGETLPFANDITEYQKEIEKNQKIIDEIEKNILDNLDKYKEQEENRIELENTFYRMLMESQNSGNATGNATGNGS